VPSTKEYQTQLTDLLSHTLAPMRIIVSREWTSFPRINGWYSPRIDIAVGPFSMNSGVSLTDTYNEISVRIQPLIIQLINYHRINGAEYMTSQNEHTNFDYVSRMLSRLDESNYNARCFMAIEIENRVSRKHLLGGTLNACALGRIGVVIGWDQSKIRALVRLQTYWNYLASVEKLTFRPDNLIILTPNQMLDAVRNYSLSS
jgi:hypothetical protein